MVKRGMLDSDGKSIMEALIDHLSNIVFQDTDILVRKIYLNHHLSGTYTHLHCTTPTDIGTCNYTLSQAYTSCVSKSLFLKHCSWCMIKSFLLQVSRNMFPRIEYLSILEACY